MHIQFLRPYLQFCGQTSQKRSLLSLETPLTWAFSNGIYLFRKAFCNGHPTITPR